MSDKILPPTDAGSKMSNKVLIRRWPDEYSLVGPPIIIKDLDDATEILAMNGWMRGWLAGKIKEALLSGELFAYEKRTFGNFGTTWRGRGDGIVAEYRMATEKEVLDFVDTAQFANVTGHAVSKRAQETQYALHYHEGAALIEAYDQLPKQAKIILDMLEETGRETFTEASIEVILTDGVARLNTKQPVMKIFGFYRARLRNEGHLEEIGGE